MKKQKFIIEDWAGNHCFRDKEFSSFEDAWGFLYKKYEHLSEKEFDDQMGEYFVEEKKPRREKRYLDPNDIRAS
jgi:hypothetical protein